MRPDLNVLYEDNHLIAVEKIPGDLSQGDKSGRAPLADFVKDYIKKKYNKPGAVFLGVIHRLDQPVGGVILFARTSKALERMNKVFKEKQNIKKYYALVEGRVTTPEAQLTNHLKKNEKQNKSYAVKESVPGAKEARLQYRVLREGDRLSLLEIELETGRHHQIRCQLSHIGHPIRGDVKYGAKRAEKEGYIFLHSVYLEFNHPTRKTERIKIKHLPTQPVLWQKFLDSTEGVGRN